MQSSNSDPNRLATHQSAKQHTPEHGPAEAPWTGRHNPQKSNTPYAPHPPPQPRFPQTAPEHGPAEAPLIGAVLEQHNLKQGGQDLREQVWPLLQVLCYCLRKMAGGGGKGDGVGCMGPQAARPTVLLPIRHTITITHCCCRRGALAAGHVAEVIARQVVHRCCALHERRAYRGAQERCSSGWL